MGAFPRDLVAAQSLAEQMGHHRWAVETFDRNMTRLRLPDSCDEFRATHGKKLRQKWRRTKKLSDQSGFELQVDWAADGATLNKRVGAVSHNFWQGNKAPPCRRPTPASTSA